MEIDELADELRALRAAAGQPSFGDIAAGVSRVRRERGQAPEQSRVARTTVYDAFRSGRRRLDAALVGDIVRALGVDDSQADDLAARCLAAQVSPSPAAATVRSAPSTRTIVLVLAGSLAANLLGRGLVDLLGLPIYLDMIGTAFSAIVLGPWWGALLGLSTNVAGIAPSGLDSVFFAPVNVAGALVWGYGVRRGMGTSIPRFFVLNLIAAATCTAIAAPIIAGLLGGSSQHSVDSVTASVLAISHSIWLSVSVANLLTSVTDKLIAGFVALTLIEALPGHQRGWVPADWMRGDVAGRSAD